MGHNIPLAGMVAGGLIGSSVAGVGLAGGALIGGMAGSALQGAPKVSTPKKRDYLYEMQNALTSQGTVQQQQLDLEKQWTPAWQNLQQTTLQGQMGVLNNLYGTAIPQSAALQQQMASAQAPVFGQVGQIAQNAYNQTLDPSTRGLFASLQNQAQTGLNAGSGLTPEMQRQAQQASRAAMTARGLTNGNQGIASEVLNSYQIGQQRQQQAQNFASNVYGMGVQNAGNAMSIFGSPLLASLNSVSPTGMLAQSQGMASSLGGNLFQPESQYNAGVYGANQSNQTQAQLANAQAKAGFNSRLMNMVGSIGAGYLMGGGGFGGFGGSSSIRNSAAMSPGGFGTGTVTGGGYYGGMGVFPR